MATECRAADYRSVLGGTDYQVNSVNVALNDPDWDMLVGGQLTPDGEAPRAYAYYFSYSSCLVYWAVQFSNLDEITAVAWTEPSAWTFNNLYMLAYVAGGQEVLISSNDIFNAYNFFGIEVMDDTFSYPGDPPGGPSSGVLFAKDEGEVVILGRNEIRYVYIDTGTFDDWGSFRIDFGDDPSDPDTLTNFGFLTDDYFVVSRVLGAVLEIHLLNSDLTTDSFGYSVDHGFSD